MRKTSSAFALSLASVVLGVSAATSQPLNLAELPNRVVSVPRLTPEFGTSSTSILTISAHNFRHLGGTEGLTDALTFMRTCQTATSCSFLGEMSLPSGAFVTGLELEGCDGDPAGRILAVVFRMPAPVQNFSAISPVGDSGAVATPGCAFFPVDVAHTVDNLTGHYLIDVNVIAGGGANVGFTAVRVRYNLQVSPAPLTATFNDVPTNHPQFQFIEALVSAGITAGCGSGNYCPDASLTRGQMAVFLAKALGLHFPN